MGLGRCSWPGSAVGGGGGGRSALGGDRRTGHRLLPSVRSEERPVTTVLGSAGRTLDRFWRCGFGAGSGRWYRDDRPAALQAGVECWLGGQDRSIAVDRGQHRSLGARGEADLLAQPCPPLRGPPGPGFGEAPAGAGLALVGDGDSGRVEQRGHISVGVGSWLGHDPRIAGRTSPCPGAARIALDRYIRDLPRRGTRGRAPAGQLLLISPSCGRRDTDSSARHRGPGDRHRWRKPADPLRRRIGRRRRAARPAGRCAASGAGVSSGRRPRTPARRPM